jgi:hypothetical protein
MLLKRVDIIKERCEGSLQSANRIMNGGDNYDGADGAREVIYLCGLIQELITIIQETYKK